MCGFSKWPSKNREDDENPLDLGVANFQTKKTMKCWNSSSRSHLETILKVIKLGEIQPEKTPMWRNSTRKNLRFRLASILFSPLFFVWQEQRLCPW